MRSKFLAGLTTAVAAVAIAAPAAHAQEVIPPAQPSAPLISPAQPAEPAAPTMGWGNKCTVTKSRHGYVYATCPFLRQRHPVRRDRQPLVQGEPAHVQAAHERDLEQRHGHGVDHELRRPRHRPGHGLQPHAERQDGLQEQGHREGPEGPDHRHDRPERQRRRGQPRHERSTRKPHAHSGPEPEWALDP